MFPLRCGRRLPVPGLSLAAVALGLAFGCAGPRPIAPPGSPLVPGCPLMLTDGALEDPEVHARCTLPPEIMRLVRPDYADDELDAPDWGALRRYQGAMPMSRFLCQLVRWTSPPLLDGGYVHLDRAAGLLLPDPVEAPGLAIAFAADPAGGEAAGCPQALPAPLHAERPFWNQRRSELVASVGPDRPFGDLRVAIDPGHYGGALGFLEQHHSWQGHPGDPPVIVQEGDLTWRTAVELRRKLEARGILVYLTRGPGEAGHPFPWSHFRDSASKLLRHLDSDPAFRALERELGADEQSRLRSAVALYAIRKQFVFESHRYRMQRAAQFHPDLMVVIHFESGPMAVGETGEERLVAMVRGNVEEHRLYNPYYRFRALRDAFEIDEFVASAHLAAHCLAGMSRTLGVPVASESVFPDHLPILRSDGGMSGVDAWNGIMFRYVTWPAVLTEGPPLHDRRELTAVSDLQRLPLHTPGTRTERYAEGLYLGITHYAAQWLEQTCNFDAQLPR